MKRIWLALAAWLTLGLGSAGAKPPVALDAGAHYPEGPLAFGGGVLVAEMWADRVSFYEAKGRRSTFFEEKGCGPTAIAPYGAGFAVLCHLSGRLALIDAQGQAVRRVEDLGNPNDGCAGPDGAVYFSSPGRFSKSFPAEGAVMRLDRDGKVRIVSEGLWYPNGVVFDPKGRALFVSEHLARRVLRYEVGEDGALGNPQVFVEIDKAAPYRVTRPYREAGPDGLDFAPNGDLVAAMYGEGRLLQFRGDGRLRREIPMPMKYVTNIGFLPNGDAVVTGGADNARPGAPGYVLRLPAAMFAGK